MLIRDIISRDVNETVGQQCVICGFSCGDPDEQGVQISENVKKNSTVISSMTPSSRKKLVFDIMC